MDLKKQQLNVFVSSTSEDLKDYRATARLIILDLGWVPKMMEHMGAIPESTISACKDKLAQCKLVVLLVAFRQGWVPTKEQGGNGVDSITALEFAFAKEQNIPVIAMFASGKTWPTDLCEDSENARKWIKNFRDNVNVPVEFFEYEDTSSEESKRLPGFRAKLKTALANYKLLQIKQAEPETQLFETAKYGLLKGNSIPFLGPALFGSGLLENFNLACTLGTNMSEDTNCLATVAEYYEKNGGRDPLLSKLKETIENKSSRILSEKVFDLILALKPRFIVSTTYDLELENKFGMGKKLAIVCHVLSSLKGKHDGKILVVLPDAEPKICLADEVDISGIDYIIYKPLGSPLLNDRLGQSNNFKDDGIDTVVITESDHLTFLSRLENQLTQVPAIFSRDFQRKSLLFLGYTLDVWQYRLFMHVFHSKNLLDAKSKSFAIRKPNSEMEIQSWDGLGIKTIQMDTNDFAEKVLKNL